MESAVTDKPIGYVINALNTNPIIRREAATMSLASSILCVEIPSNIETLTPKQYVNLRDRYEDIREPFQHAVRTLCDDCQLAQINGRRQFEETVRTATRKFCDETEELRKGLWTKRRIKWSIMSLSVLSSFCALGIGLTLKLGVGITAGLHVYQSLKGSPHITDKRQAMQLMGTLKGELNHRILLRRIGTT